MKFSIAHHQGNPGTVLLYLSLVSLHTDSVRVNEEAAGKEEKIQ